MPFALSLQSAVLALSILGGAAASTLPAAGQAQDTNPPAAPEPAAPEAAGAPGAPGAQAPAPSNAPLPPLPTPDPRNFTASTPTQDTVNQFLKQSWGYDANRIFQVAAIQKTPAPGVSRVIVLVEEKGSGQQQPSSISFFTTPDGKHLIADEVLPFGARPFDDYRNTLRKEANGPARGGAGKDLLLVEFADFECPHCKDAQPTVDKLLKDFPNARFVAESFPLAEIHSEAMKAAEYGACVAKLGGDTAFFKFSDDVYAHQAGLTPQNSTATLRSAAQTAGQDPAKVAACAALPETKATVDAQHQLGVNVGVNSTPTLFINGRGVPFAGIPYDTLKQIVAYQEQIDGTTTAAK